MPQVAGRARRSIGFSLLDGGNAVQRRLRGRQAEAVRGPHAAAADSAQALIGRMFGAVQQIRSANVVPFNLPPIIGLSTSGGFEYQLREPGGPRPGARWAA